MWHPRGLLPVLDCLDDDVPHDAGTKWIYGAITPVLLSIYASSIFYAGFVTLGRRMHRMQMHGTPAYCLAGAAIGCALLLHCRYFWSQSKRLAGWSELGVLVSLLVLVACLIGCIATGFSLI